MAEIDDREVVSPRHAFVQVRAAGTKPVEARLEIRIDTNLVSIRDLTLEPDTPQSLLVPVEGNQGAVLTLQVSTLSRSSSTIA